jgi:hypothetical protein
VDYCVLNNFIILFIFLGDLFDYYISRVITNLTN